MKSELIYPSIADASWIDGRGAILTYIPDKHIVEFNILYFNKGCTRGNHFHPDPDLVEFFGVLQGEGIFNYVDTDTKIKHTIFMSKGMFVRTPPFVSHAFYSLGETTCMALLTKKWDDAKPSPIVHDEVTNQKCRVNDVIFTDGVKIPDGMRNFMRLDGSNSSSCKICEHTISGVWKVNQEIADYVCEKCRPQ